MDVRLGSAGDQNTDFPVCAPSGVALRCGAKRERTKCPFGAQAAGLCSICGGSRAWALIIWILIMMQPTIQARSAEDDKKAVETL
jgi:hypothetical protein